jgi:CheY-like chemotaxis protein
MSNRKVLVVDDDVDIRECLDDVLIAEGFNTLKAGNGKEALEILESGETPCLILLDLMMPVMNAEEFIELQRSRERIKDIPIFLMSASNFIEQNAINFKTKGHLRKPFDFQELLQVVRGFKHSNRSM